MIRNSDKTKSKSRPSHKYQKYVKYKWEFLRRNPDYIKEYEELNTLLKPKYNNKVPSYKMMLNDEMIFCLKWKIAFPLCYENSYDDFIQNYKDSPIDPYALMFNALIPELMHEKPITTIEDWSEEDGKIIDLAKHKVAETGKLKIEIDLNYSKKRLKDAFILLLDEFKDFYDTPHKSQLFLEYVKKLIDEVKLSGGEISDISNCKAGILFDKKLQKKYDRLILEKRKKHGQLNRFDDFDKFLKVYDLKAKNISWSKIAKQLGFDNIQTARNHYESARRLINTGIDLYIK